MALLQTFLRHGSNAALAVLAVVLAVPLVLAHAAWTVPAIVLGACVFFGSEYTTHRFLLHAPPQRSAFIRSLQHRLHYDHHVDPADLRLLFLPLWFALPAAALTAAIYAALSRDAAITAALLLGSVAALLYYEWVHYVAHIGFVPRTSFGRWIKKYHLRHHYLNERRGFGVTNPALDVLLRTYATAAVARSSTTRTLFAKP